MYPYARASLTPPASNTSLPLPQPHASPTAPFLALPLGCMCVAPSAAHIGTAPAQTSREDVGSNLTLPNSDPQCSDLLVQVHRVPQEEWW